MPASGFAPTLSPQLRAMMRRQRGVFTADQAYDVGYSPDEVQRMREAGVVCSVRRGVYALAAQYAALDPLSRHEADVQAALLRVKQPATVSHESAAVWTSLELLRPNLRNVQFTRPELRASRREAGIHHHLGELPQTHLRVVEDVVVTAPARTAVDIARWTDFARGLAAADSCLRDGTSRQQLRQVMEFCSCWPGGRRASRVVAAADGRAANPGESWSRAVLIEAGFEPTSIQLEVRDEAGLIGFADFGWEEQMTLGEFDGRRKYGVAPGSDPEQAGSVVWREKRREDRLRAAGFDVVRWTWEDLHRPAALIARLQAAFARAGSRRRTAV